MRAWEALGHLRRPKPPATHRRNPRRVHPPLQVVTMEGSSQSQVSSFAVSNTGTWGSVSSKTQPQPGPSHLGIAPLWQDLPVRGGKEGPTHQQPAPSPAPQGTRGLGRRMDRGRSGCEGVRVLASWNMRAVCLYKKITASQIHMSLHVLSSSEVIINSCIQWWLSMGDTNVVYMYMYICCSNSSVYFLLLPSPSPRV